MDPLGIAFFTALVGIGVLAHVLHVREVARQREGLQTLGREPGFTYEPSSNGKGTGQVRGSVDGVPVEIRVDLKGPSTTYQVHYDSGAPWFELEANSMPMTQDPAPGHVVYDLGEPELQRAYAVSAYEPGVRQILSGRPGVRGALLELARRRQGPRSTDAPGCFGVRVLADRANVLWPAHRDRSTGRRSLSSCASRRRSRLPDRPEAPERKKLRPVAGASQILPRTGLEPAPVLPD